MRAMNGQHKRVFVNADRPIRRPGKGEIDWQKQRLPVFGQGRAILAQVGREESLMATRTKALGWSSANCHKNRGGRDDLLTWEGGSRTAAVGGRVNRLLQFGAEA
jgi:hypothetical protein